MKSLKTNLSALFFILFASVAVAQNGTIKGLVKDASTSEGVAFANVVIEGTTVGATTDFDGNYEIQVEEGTYTLVFSFVGYETIKKEGVVVTADEVIEVNADMGTSSQMMGTLELEGEMNREAEGAITLDIKESDDIKTAIGAETLTKTGVSNVAQGLTKVTGLSTVGSRYIFVRGMGDRYNNATLNGLPLPSPNPDTKIPQLNIFPTSIVQTLEVVKSFTPSLYGDFSGGNINIQTKTANEEKALVIGIGTGMNTRSTFNDFTSYEGSSTDVLGYDNGDRDLPADIASSGYSSANVANSFTHNLNPTIKTAPVNGSFSIGYIRSKTLENEESKLGVVASYNYGNSYGYQEGQLRQINKQDRIQLDYDTKNYTFSTNTSALLGVNFDKNSTNKYRANVLYVNLSNDQVRELEGSNFDYSSTVAARRYTFRQNQMMVSQLLGDHSFMEDDKLKVDWGVSYSIASSDEPDRRQMVFLKTGADTYNINKIDINENHRFFSELDEKEASAKLNATYVLKYSDGEEKEPISKIDAGFNFRNKTRDFDYRQFNYKFGGSVNAVNYLNPEGVVNTVNIGNESVQLVERGDPASKQASSLRVMAGYADYTHKVGQRLEFKVGSRVEQSVQDTNYKDAATGLEKTNELNETYLLPSVGVRFDYTDEHVFRGSFSKTISRPGFREMATFEYTEDFAGEKTRGNPNLLNGENLNLDLKWEFYPQAGQMFAVSAFGKVLDKPIEKTALASASGRLISFENAKDATVAGLEMEYTGNLYTIFGNESLRKFDVGFNAAYIFTEVSSEEGAAAGGASKIFTNPTRPLQGASPYLLNMNLTFNFDNGMEEDENRKKGSLTLAYNLYGKRLFAAGIQGIGDAYEMPVGTLNLTYTQEITDKFDLKLNAKNLLDPTIEVIQENETQDHTINSYQRGINFGISLNYKLM